VTYGTSPASFLATRCLCELAVRGQEEFPKASDALLSNFYVDDYLGGAPTIEEAKRTREQITALLATAGFPIRKWCSSNNEIMESIPAEEREAASLCLSSENDDIKTWHHMVS
jgi:predicted alpha/beta hydrolase family esterase